MNDLVTVIFHTDNGKEYHYLHTIFGRFRYFSSRLAEIVLISKDHSYRIKWLSSKGHKKEKQGHFRHFLKSNIFSLILTRWRFCKIHNHYSQNPLACLILTSNSDPLWHSQALQKDHFLGGCCRILTLVGFVVGWHCMLVMITHMVVWYD